MNVSLEFAEDHLADLVSAADSGEQVEISRPGKRSLKLVVSNAASPGTHPVTREGKRILGAGRGELRVPSEEEWKKMDEEIAREMNDGPLFPPDSK
jgi:antitoxin (DNA-binding transcriptional repressor) of toxin-antitoxin stability system